MSKTNQNPSKAAAEFVRLCLSNEQPALLQRKSSAAPKDTEFEDLTALVTSLGAKICASSAVTADHHSISVNAQALSP